MAQLPLRWEHHGRRSRSDSANSQSSETLSRTATHAVDGNQSFNSNAYILAYSRLHTYQFLAVASWPLG